MGKSQMQPATAPKFDVQLPAAFQTAGAIELVQRGGTPFVHICQPKSSDFYSKILSKYPGSVEGEAFLFMSYNGDLIKLNPFKFAPLNAKQFWVCTAQNGDVLQCSDTQQEYTKTEHWGDDIISAILVYLPDRIIPAMCEWRTTKCSGFGQAVEALKEASTPEWLKKSPEHAHTAVCNQPWMRFTATTIVRSKPSKKEETAGSLYHYLVANIQPTGSVEWELLQKALVDNPAFHEDLNDVAEQYTKDVARYMALVK